MMRVGAGLLLLAALVACAGAPEPVPFRGPAPTSIAILPLRAPDVPDELRGSLDGSVALRLADRGYSIVGASVIGSTLESGRPLDLEVLHELRREFGVDAVLERTARTEPGRLDDGDRPFSVQWTILATGDGAVLWSRREHGGPTAVVSRQVMGAPGSYEPDPLFSDEPVIGRGDPQFVDQVRARDVGEQAMVVHRALCARLPEAAAR